jgi:hypothetical protein
MSSQLHGHILVVYHLHPGDILLHPVGLELILLPVGQEVVDRLAARTRGHRSEGRVWRGEDGEAGTALTRAR